MKSSLYRRLSLAAVMLSIWAVPSLHAQSNPSDSLIVSEDGVGANEVVNISSSTLGDNLWVYACAIEMLVDGYQTQGFCIDPWHWSLDGNMTYTEESLQDGPKDPGPMGAETALEVSQLYEEYYSPTMSNATAAGLQIAIWTLVSASVELNTDGASWYTLNSGDDYGASTMIAWVQANPTAATADVVAITGVGQDYLVQAAALPSATINAAPTAYTGSPFTVSSVASAPDDNLTLHTIEWLAPTGDWTVNSAVASGGSDSRAVGITFPSTGTYTLRSGVSVDNGNTWLYSPNASVAVTSGLASYTLASMAVPSASSQTWYAPSSVVEKTYQVQHVNP